MSRRGTLKAFIPEVGSIAQHVVQPGEYVPLKDGDPWPAYVIKETSTFKERWDVLILGCIFYSALGVPYRLCFRSEAEGALWVFEASMSLLFLTDLVLSFRTAFLVDGLWVASPDLIAKRYLKSWFWIDAPSSVPVELISLVFVQRWPSNSRCQHCAVLHRVSLPLTAVGRQR